MKTQEIKKQLGNFIEVENFVNYKGNTIPNQFKLRFENGEVYQSYGSLIAINTHGNIYLTDKWDYSRTTIKYLHQWLGTESKKEIENLIKIGNISLLTE